MIKLSDFVIDYVAKLGVKHIFMLPGGGCMHLVDSVGKNKNIDYVANLHEQAAAIGADAYSQYTNNFGAVLVTTGPGSTNAITGVAASWIESIPILFISGQAKRSDLMKDTGVRQMGIQEVDIISLVKPITKYAKTVMEPSDIKVHLDRAIYAAKNGKQGPVWLDIPLDVQGTMIDEKTLKGFECAKTETPSNGQQIKDVISLINNAKRPVILAGNGIRLAGGLKPFKKLINELKIPILTTWKSIDFLAEDHPLFFGRPGSIGQRGANFVQQNSDLIITIGARLDYGQVGFSHKNFAREAKKVIVDIDPTEIKKIDAPIDVEIAEDAKIFIDQLLEHIDDIKRPDISDWLAHCKEWKEKYPVILGHYKESKKFVNTYVLVDVLSDLLNRDDVIVPGSSGSCSEITLQAFRIKEGQRFLNSPGLGSMGFGVAASIGACIASGKKRTTCLIGDGGLQHNIQELELLKRYQLPVKIFVLNNNGYGSIRTTHQRHFNGLLVACDPTSGLTFPDTINIAKAYGLTAVKIENHENIEEQIKAVLESNEPVICEVMVDPELLTSPKLSSEVKPDGKIVSKPMEDLWPFLDREEFKQNMLIKPLEE